MTEDKCKYLHFAFAFWLLISKCNQQSGHRLEMWKGTQLWMQNKSVIRVVKCHRSYRHICVKNGQKQTIFPPSCLTSYNSVSNQRDCWTLTTIRGFLWKHPETMIASVGPPVMKPITEILLFGCDWTTLASCLGLEPSDGAAAACVTSFPCLGILQGLLVVGSCWTWRKSST